MRTSTPVPKLPHIIASFAFVFQFLVGPLPADCRAQEKPNIILIMADDLGWGDPTFNDGWIETPALDALASAGIKFNRFYSASAVCSPTRASCLTGRNPHRVGVPGANRGKIGQQESLLSEVLSEIGYTTGALWQMASGNVDHPAKGLQSRRQRQVRRLLRALAPRL